MRTWDRRNRQCRAPLEGADEGGDRSQAECS